MASPAIPGFEAQVYVGGVKLLELSDVKLKVSADELDVSSHTSGGWKAKIGGLKEWGLTADSWFVDGDATHLALYNALVNGAPVSIELRSKDVSGKQKWSGTGRVLNWDYDASQSEAQGESIEISGDGALVSGTV